MGETRQEKVTRIQGMQRRTDTQVTGVPDEENQSKANTHNCNSRKHPV